MVKRILLNNLQGVTTGAAVFGGTFDPIHEGHLGVIRQLVAHFPKVIVAPTSQNPWKTDATKLSHRVVMINLALKWEGLDLAASVYEDGYVYAIDLVRKLGESEPMPLFWVVGEDIAPEVEKWRDFEPAQVAVIVAPIRIPIHATEIRQSSAGLHPAIVDYAATNGLYRPPTNP